MKSLLEITTLICLCLILFCFTGIGFSQPLDPNKNLKEQIESRIVTIEFVDKDEQATIGSGIIISPEGHILTAKHLFNLFKDNTIIRKDIFFYESHSPVQLAFNDLYLQGSQPYLASKSNDIAIFKVNAGGLGHLPYLCINRNLGNLDYGEDITIATFHLVKGGQYGGKWDPYYHETIVSKSVNDGLPEYESFLGVRDRFEESKSGGAILWNNEVIGIIKGQAYLDQRDLKNYGLVDLLSSVHQGINWDTIPNEGCEPQVQEENLQQDYFHAGCGVGNRIALFPIPNTSDEEDQAFAEFLNSLENIGLGNHELTQKLTNVKLAVDSEESKEFTNEEWRELISQFFNAMNGLPNIVRANSSQNDYQWFKFCKLLYEVATNEITSSYPNVDAQDISNAATIKAFESHVETMDLSDVLRAEAIDFIREARNNQDLDALFQTANELALTVYTTF